MAGRRFVDFGDLQAQVIAWCNEVNHRIHGTTGERPADLWKDEISLVLMGHDVVLIGITADNR
jgi:hypothetical protein